MVSYSISLYQGFDGQNQDDSESEYRRIQEIESLEETLDQDPVANHPIRMGRIELKFIDWIYLKWGRVGELPMDYAPSEATSIKNYRHGYKWPDPMLNKAGRVRGEYVFDEMLEKFGMDLDQFLEHVNNLFRQKSRLNNLKRHRS
jgi:hypothetical protein